MLIIALARSACNLSKTGSPNPTGTFLIIVEMRPPTVSPDLRTASMNSIISFAVAGSAHRAILDSLKSNNASKSFVSKFGDSILPTPDTCANISIPCCFKKDLAIAPAATLAAVSLADERPPPR
ncbi:hypothetical protein D3C87_1812680 [compost metagenome]